MTESRCLPYALLARSLMEIYRDTPDREILSMAAGVTFPSNGVTEIHKAMAEHFATCDLCRKTTTPARRSIATKRAAARAKSR